MCQDRCGPITTGFKQTRQFNMALSEMSLPIQINKGIGETESDLIVLFESDRILPAGYFEAVIYGMQPKTMVTTQRMWRVSRMVSDTDISQQRFPHYEEWRNTKNELLTRNMFSGNTTFWKEDFYAAGAADESYIGYGWLDHDLTSAMELIGVEPVYREELELHLWHEPMTYGEKDQKKLFIKNAIHYCKKWKRPYPPEIVKEIQKQSKAFI